MDLQKHIGHHLACNKYGKKVELECLTCHVTMAVGEITGPIIEEAPAPEVCTMEEGCLSCGS